MIISIDTASSPCSRTQARAASMICSRRASRRSSLIRGMRSAYHKREGIFVLDKAGATWSAWLTKRTFLLFVGGYREQHHLARCSPDRRHPAWFSPGQHRGRHGGGLPRAGGGRRGDGVAERGPA